MTKLANEYQKPVTEAWLRRCREVVAQCWCRPATSMIEMNPQLAEEFALVLAQETSCPWLGNATTRELQGELAARTSSDPEYYTAAESQS